MKWLLVMSTCYNLIISNVSPAINGGSGCVTKVVETFKTQTSCSNMEDAFLGFESHYDRTFSCQERSKYHPTPIDDLMKGKSK